MIGSLITIDYSFCFTQIYSFLNAVFQIPFYTFRQPLIVLIYRFIACDHFKLIYQCREILTQLEFIQSFILVNQIL